MSRLRHLEVLIDKPNYRPSSTQAVNDLRYVFTLIQRHRSISKSRRTRATREADR